MSKLLLLPWADIKRQVGVLRLTSRINNLAREQRAFLRGLAQRTAIRAEDWAVNDDPRYFTRLEESPWYGLLTATKTPRPQCIRGMRDPNHDPRLCDICLRLAEGSHPYEGGPPRIDKESGDG